MRRLRTTIVGTVAAIATLAVMSTATALAETSHPAAAAHPAAVSADGSQARPTNSARPDIPRSPRNCPKAFFCSYNQSGSPATPCLYTEADNYNWSGSCANADEAVYNYVPNTWKTRLYYFPSGWVTSTHSAWMCIDGGDYLDNVSTYKFDQGIDGYGQSIWQNVASDSIVAGSCSPNE
jgi:hypothetical protein